MAASENTAGGSIDLTTPAARLAAGQLVFGDLSQPMRAWALVGCYVGYFALLERSVEKALQRLTRTDALSGAILGRNMGAMEKMRAVRTLVNLGLPEGEMRTRFDALMRSMIKVVEERNVVAHTPFGASQESNGVTFHTVDAMGTLRFTPIDWSLEKAQQRIDHLRALADQLDSDQEQAVLRLATEILSTSSGARDAMRDFLASLDPLAAR